MTHTPQIHTVCPHCKRLVVALRGQVRAHCLEHGAVVPMRSAIANRLPVPVTHGQAP